MARLGDAVPARAETRELFRNPQLAATYRRICHESRGGSREEEIERAHGLFYTGFVADEIDGFSAENGGLLAGDDLAGWRATLEEPATYDYAGYTVCKTAPWGQGPVFLQQLALLDGFDVADMSPAELVHTVIECAKLAFADRDALYGDADCPARPPAVARVQRRAPEAGHRRRVVRAPARPRPDAAARRGGGDTRLR